MRRVALGLVGLLAIVPAGARAKDLAVRAEVRKGPHYVGETIAAAVGVEAGAERPTVAPPRVDGVEIHAAGVSVHPIATSAIGDVVDQSNRYVFHFQLVPRQPGTKVLGPFVAKYGTQTGASVPLRVDVRNPPAAGRPGSFLGGVGALSVKAQARPSSIRLGQELEYRVILRGPGARGSTRPPDLPRLTRSALAPRVLELPVEASHEPPVRVFRYQIRPTRAGSDVLPPVPVSWFEPSTGRYQTKVTPSVSLRVIDVPSFEAQGLDYTVPEGPAGAGRAMLPVCLGLGGLLLAAGLLAWVRRSRVRRVVSASQIAEGLLNVLDSGDGPESPAKWITEGLADYLRVAVGRPPGVLTPVEASEGILRFTGDAKLAEEAGRLIAACDRSRFEASVEASMLARPARELFRTLQGFKPGPENAARGSRDA